jgi:hypothetical protein
MPLLFVNKQLNRELVAIIYNSVHVVINEVLLKQYKGTPHIYSVQPKRGFLSPAKWPFNTLVQRFARDLSIEMVFRSSKWRVYSFWRITGEQLFFPSKLVDGTSPEVHPIISGLLKYLPTFESLSTLQICITGFNGEKDCRYPSPEWLVPIILCCAKRGVDIKIIPRRGNKMIYLIFEEYLAALDTCLAKSGSTVVFRTTPNQSIALQALTNEDFEHKEDILKDMALLFGP